MTTGRLDFLSTRDAEDLVTDLIHAVRREQHIAGLEPVQLARGALFFQRFTANDKTRWEGHSPEGVENAQRKFWATVYSEVCAEVGLRRQALLNAFSEGRVGQEARDRALKEANQEIAMLRIQVRGSESDARSTNLEVPLPPPIPRSAADGDPR